MAGFVIHLCVGEEYIRNFPDEIANHDEFINGIIYPDLTKDKATTHYGPKSSKVNLKKFFENNDIFTDFNKGYFLHLVTDYLFYNKFLKVFSKKYIYDDYDILNKQLIEEFRIKIPKIVVDQIFFKEGTTKILILNDVIEFIKETAKYNLKDVKREVMNDNKDWLELKTLKKI